jgi:dihydrofolate synthase/folylpolyglutamate synthase
MIKSFGADFKVALSDTGGCRYTDDGGGFDFSPSLKGEHQAHNMAVAIAVARIVGATVEECQRGVSGLYWPGRLESLSFEGREVIIDAAHNPAGISSLIAFLKSRDIRPQIAFGAIETKNWRGMVESLAPYVGDWLIMEPDFPKAVPAREIVAFLSGFGITARSFGGDYGAFTEELRGGSNPFLVCGSIYLIGIVRDLMCGGGSVLWEPVGR